MSSVNKVTLIGNLGKDPEVRAFSSGDKVCNLSIATSESWKDKATGERKERTEWHRVAIHNQQYVDVAEKYLAKGSKVYLVGKLETREYEKDGQKFYTTEVVLRQFGSELVMLDGKDGAAKSQEPKQAYNRPAPANPLDDSSDIPFYEQTE